MRSTRPKLSVAATSPCPDGSATSRSTLRAWSCSAISGARVTATGRASGGGSLPSDSAGSGSPGARQRPRYYPPSSAKQQRLGARHMHAATHRQRTSARRRKQRRKLSLLPTSRHSIASDPPVPILAMRVNARTGHSPPPPALMLPSHLQRTRGNLHRVMLNRPGSCSSCMPMPHRSQKADRGGNPTRQGKAPGRLPVHARRRPLGPGTPLRAKAAPRRGRWRRWHRPGQPKIHRSPLAI
jgi:hypothetical protein